MNILSNYTQKYGMVIFTHYVDFSNKRDFRSWSRYNDTPKYCFKIPNSIEELSPGDYIAVDTKNGIKIAVFVNYTIDRFDIQLATKNVLSKIGANNVYNYRI